MDAMDDAELTSWLAAVAGLNGKDDDADDALLHALLLYESPRPRDSAGIDVSRPVAAASGLNSPHAAAVNDAPGLSTAPRLTTATTAQSTTLTTSPVPRRKKPRSTWRSKDEIERLRRSVADLEELLALRTRPTADPQQLLVTPTGAASGVASEIWRGVAVRQFQRLREAQYVNRDLRTRVEHQLAIIKSVARLVQRTRRHVASYDIPRSPTQLDAALIAYKHQELLATANAMHLPTDYVATDHAFRLQEGEFQATQTLPTSDRGDVQPGTILGQSRARRLVPSTIPGLSDQLWAVGKAEDTNHTRYKILHVEHHADHFFTAFSLEFPTADGLVVYRGAGGRARVRRDSRDAVVTVGSIWPDASTPLPFQHTGMDVRAWMVVQPCITSTVGHEVLFHAECSRIVTPVAIPTSIAHVQAAVLDGIVVNCQKFMLEQTDRFIDAVLLSA